MDRIKLSQHFGWRELLIYSLPAVGNMIANTSFGVIDGLFASNLLGEDPFIAILQIGPFFYIVIAIGYMYGSGTSAQVSHHMGGGRKEKGRRIFSMSVIMAVLTGVVLGLIFAACTPQIASFLNVDARSCRYCVDYGRILFLFLPAFLVSTSFQSLWITADRSALGLFASLLQGTLNIILDWIFMGPLKMGVTGAALATGIAGLLEALFCISYFCKKRGSDLYFVRFSVEDVKETGGILFNGSSDLVDSATDNVSTLVMNFLLIKYIGDMGIACRGVYNYVAECFMAVFFGVASTAITVVGYKCGMKDKKELDGVLKNGMVMMLIVGIIMWVLCLLLAAPIAKMFLNYDPDAVDMTIYSLRISSSGFVLAGINFFVAAFFTGLEDGLASIAVSLMFALIAPVTAAFALTAVFGGDAIWYTTPVATAVTTVLCFVLIKTRYANVNLDEIDIDMDEF